VIGKKALQLMLEAHDIDTAMDQNIPARFLQEHGEQQMLQGQVFMPTALDLFDGAGQYPFQLLAEHSNLFHTAF
jgi:hypothetical protein